MPGIGSYLARMRTSISGGAPQPQSAAGQMAGQLAAGQQAGMPVQTPGQQFGQRLQQGLQDPLFNVGLGILQGSQPGGGGALAGALGGAQAWQQMQLAQARNAMLLKKTEAELEGLKLTAQEKRLAAAGREALQSYARQNPGASPQDLIRLAVETTGDPKLVTSWTQSVQRDDQRQQLAGYRDQLLEESKRYHDSMIEQGQQRIGIQQATEDRLAATAGKPGQPRQRSLGSTRDVPLGGDQWQREELISDGSWRQLGSPYRRASNPLAELLSGGDQPQPSVSPQGPAPTQGSQEQADRAQAAALVQANPGLRNTINQRLIQAYGRGL